MKFKDEFSRKNFTLNLDCTGGSENVFVQSKVDCISPSGIMMFRMTACLYLLFGMLLSLTFHEESHPWTVYMTSVNYMLVVIYFVFGFIISTYAIFFKKNYYRHSIRGTTTRKCNLIQNTRDNTIMTITPCDNSSSALPKSTKMGQGKLDLTQNRCSVDSLLYHLSNKQNRMSLPIINASNVNSNHAIKEPINRQQYNFYSVTDLHGKYKLSQQNVTDLVYPRNNGTATTAPANSCQNINDNLFRHARLHNNQCPKVNIEIVADGKSSKLGVFFKLYWFSSTVTLNLTLLTVFVYWSMMYRKQSNQSSQMKWFLRIDRHGIVLLFMVIDHMISGIPTRLLHFIYPSLLFVLYGFVSAIYTIVTRDYVYRMLNFSENGLKSVLYVAGASFVAIPILQLIIYWVVYRVRERLFRSF